MNMFARFDENPAMTLRVIKETKRYGQTHGQRENSIPPTNKVCGGYKKDPWAFQNEWVHVLCSPFIMHCLGSIEITMF